MNSRMTDCENQKPTHRKILNLNAEVLSFQPANCGSTEMTNHHSSLHTMDLWFANLGNVSSKTVQLATWSFELSTIMAFSQLGTWAFRYLAFGGLGICTLGHLDTWVFGHLDTWVFGHLESWELGHLGTSVSRHMRLPATGILDIWTPQKFELHEPWILYWQPLKPRLNQTWVSEVKTSTLRFEEWWIPVSLIVRSWGQHVRISSKLQHPRSESSSSSNSKTLKF